MSSKSKWNTVRLNLSSAWSIEETGLLDSSIYEVHHNITTSAQARQGKEKLGGAGMKSRNWSKATFSGLKDISKPQLMELVPEPDEPEDVDEMNKPSKDISSSQEPSKDIPPFQEPLEDISGDISSSQEMEKPLKDIPQTTPSELRPRILARNRWKQLKNTVAFANHMSAIKSSSNDLLQERVDDSQPKPDAGRVGAAAFEGSKTEPQVKAKGRKGMEGLIVYQDKGYVSYFQDFYVAFLKLSTLRFFIGVFLAPVALALLFTPIYLFDIEGLTFADQRDEKVPICNSTSKWNCLNVVLYALSLSTTFGGSPLAALSPFCLLVANVHTLMAQFLFVFLSGAVFARMSQPAHPIRCSKKAIIKDNDFSSENEDEAKSKVFVVRMVLSGPPPCELVDAKIRLTFRIFLRLQSGSMFCSTQDLELVRSEVAYLRYGLTVRHVITSKSPIFGHTIESLMEGDASFSLTIMGVERSSMQPIFHLEDYFVCDGDVVWDGEYLDFVRVNDKGQRVLDHSKIDMLKPLKVAGVVLKAIHRMEGDVARHKAELEIDGKEDEKSARHYSSPTMWRTDTPIRRLWRTMSNSFTRTPWG